MSLADLIRGKSVPVKFATATPAIFATQRVVKERTVASVATVAVANPCKPIPELIPATLEKVSADDSVTVSRRWLIHYPHRDPIKVACRPHATHAEILERHSDAIAAEPIIPTIRQPSAPMNFDEETAIRAWLALIEETDQVIIAELIERCQQDVDAQAYFSGRAAVELLKPDPFPDDRRTCEQCANLVTRQCQAAKRGEIVASRDYEPIRGLPRRCEGYAPGADDPDRRHGRQRWPGLIQKGGE